MMKKLSAFFASLTFLSLVAAPAYAIGSPMSMSSEDNIPTPTPTISQQQQYSADGMLQTGMDPNFQPDQVMSVNSLKIKTRPLFYNASQPLKEHTVSYPSAQLEQPMLKMKTYSAKDNHRLSPIEVNGQ